MIRAFVHNILVLHGLTFGKNYKLGFGGEKKDNIKCFRIMLVVYRVMKRTTEQDHCLER